MYEETNSGPAARARDGAGPAARRRSGGVAIDVSSENHAFEFKRIFQSSVNPSSWVKDTDYTLSLNVTDASGAERTAEFGTAVNWGKTDISCLFVAGDTVSMTAVPDKDLHPNYNPAAVSTSKPENQSLTLTCNEFVTVTAPEGSTVDAGTLANYYVYTFFEPVTRSVEDGTATFHFDKSNSIKSFYRVRHPDGATYWNYVNPTADTTYTVTEEDLGLTGDFSKDTIYHFENNVYDRAGIYLNINPKGYKNMAVGDTFELNSFRNWFAIESAMNNKVALPEMHYQVIDVNGNPSDVVAITPNELNSNVAVMEAKKEGTAIVLVTYDAMTHMQGQSSTASKRFSAIWPELTGVFVVNVGADGSAIQTNMKLDRMDAVIEKDEAKQLDAEHDILFYTGTEGASYSFKPEDGCTVSVLHPTVTETSMTYSGGFTTNDVTTAEDGTSIDRKNLTVTLADSAGTTILVSDDGTFQSYAEEYFYTVSGAGVEYASGSVTMTNEGPNAFTITLQTTAEGAWDGKTQTEPQTDENGVYQIGTGAELAWFVAKSKDTDVSGVLTANIDLGKYAWLNITSSKKVELDGAGFEITGLNAATGLFVQTGSNSHFHNLTIRGAVSGKGYAGVIVGYASGSAPKFENCFNYAAVTSTGNNVGGLVGYTYQNAVIENCANFGAVTGGSSFSDVRSGSYYEKAVAWAAANGIVTGTGSTAFSPDAKVTREQLAAILYRYAQYKELATNADAKLNSFTDAGSVSGYASEALDWAVSEGLINGASGKLMPKGDATRVQVAAIFHRFVKNVVK